MPRITPSVFTLAVTFSLLLVSAQAQTTGIELTIDSHQVQFAVQGEAQEMRVEVFAPSGEMVFDSGAVKGRMIEWKMLDEKGARVADGLYLATITIRSQSGKIRKRIEQINVGLESQASAQMLAPDALEATITGSGTNGKIAKFTGAATIGNSVITESSGKIGIGTPGAPVARLHINGDQPADLADNGTTASTLLRTSGGKGGKTTATGKRGGTGASILLMAGNGGDAVSGATNGNGGSITLQPGSEGFGGVGGKDGNVLLAPLLGNVGIGTVLPESKLAVLGSSAGSVLRVDNNSSSTFGQAVLAISKGGTGVHGSSDSGIGVAGVSHSHYAIFGRTDTPTGYAGYFIGRVHITNGCTGCDPPSDRRLKANFSAVNPRTILDRLASIPIQTWNYKSEAESVRHIGVTAQDFRSAFGFGESDHKLNTVDAQGVTMAAIQGLYQMMREKDRQIEELTRRVREQQTQLNQVKRTIKRKRTASR